MLNEMGQQRVKKLIFILVHKTRNLFQIELTIDAGCAELPSFMIHIKAARGEK